MVLHHPQKGPGVSDYLFPLLTITWLALVARADLHSRSVPNWLTLPPLIASLITACFRMEWAAAALMVLLVFVSDLPLVWGVGLALGSIILFWWLSGETVQSATLGKCLLLFGIWLLWRVGGTGGADAKVLLTLTLLYGVGILLAAFFAGGIFGLVAWIRKQRTLPYLVPVFLGSSVYFLWKFIFHA